MAAVAVAVKIGEYSYSLADFPPLILKGIMKLAKIQRKMILAFMRRRRASMILVFKNRFKDQMKAFFLQIIFRKNIHFHTIWNKKHTDSKIQVFLFRDMEKLAKYLEAEKFSWGEDDKIKAVLMGEALGYPKFAVDDFIEMTGEESPRKICFRNFDFGYDALVFRAKNLPKMMEWLAKEKIPRQKSSFQIFENRKWRDLSAEEFKKFSKS